MGIAMDEQGNSGLKKAGLKVTGPRLKILKILESNTQRHMSAEEVYRLLLETGDDVGLATVYRVLTQFEASGLVIRHNFEGGQFVFELNAGEHHDHLVCIKCGFVQEFVDTIIERRQAIIAKEASFKMTDHALVIYGLCNKCVAQDTNQ